MASRAIQIRNVLAEKIQGITAAWCVTNGFSHKVVIPRKGSTVGNFVSPYDRGSFPYVHISHPISDYRDSRTASGQEVPYLNMEITGFVKDSKDGEAVADELGQAIIKIITEETTQGELAIQTMYATIESYEIGEEGLATVEISLDVMTIGEYGDIGSG